MKNKKGITISMLAVVITVLAILTTAVVTSVSNSIENSKLTIWTQEISLIQDLMKENKETADNFLLEEVEFDVSTMSSNMLRTQFAAETITSNKITLYKINVTKLGLEDIVYGKYKSTNDIYAYSKETGRVYYLEGIRLNSDKYFTLTTELINKYDVQDEVGSALSTIVFKASSIAYTNQPITVTVNVPKTYTSIRVTTSNSNVTVGSQVTETGKYTYAVNTANYAGNYTITVAYDDGAEKTIQYVVDIYDGVAPTISSVTRTNNTVTINTTDDNTGIKEIRYITAGMPTENVQEYFRTNSTKVSGNTFNVDSSVTNIVVYVEDNAGNYVTKTI